MTESSVDTEQTLVVSLKPRFAEAILGGTKTVEVRRCAPAVPAMSAYAAGMAPRRTRPSRRPEGEQRHGQTPPNPPPPPTAVDKPPWGPQSEPPPERSVPRSGFTCP